MEKILKKRVIDMTFEEFAEAFKVYNSSNELFGEYPDRMTYEQTMKMFGVKAKSTICNWVKAGHVQTIGKGKTKRVLKSSAVKYYKSLGKDA